MKILKIAFFLWCSCVLFSCSDSGSGNSGKDFDMTNKTNKYWYCNKWQNTKTSYSKEDLVEAIRFNSDGQLWEMDYSGRVENLVGSWTSEENRITLKYDDGKQEVWNVLKSDNNSIRIMNSGWEKTYVIEPSYLQDLTGDAYLYTEVEPSGSSTRLSVSVSGKNAAKIKSDALIILSETQTVPLVYKSASWVEKEVISAESLGLPGRVLDVVFYVNISGQPVKFLDRIYNTEVYKKDFASFGLDAINKDRVLTVKWNPFYESNVYYQVEVLNEKLDSGNPYFISDLLPAWTPSIEIDNTTKTLDGFTNRINDLKDRGQKFNVRLSAVQLEPGVSVNSKYSYVNLQSVTHVTRLSVWQ